MVGVDVVVHQMRVAGEEQRVPRQDELFYFVKDLLAILDVSWHVWFESLEPIVEPFTPAVHPSGDAAYDWAKHPRNFVDLRCLPIPGKFFCVFAHRSS